MWASEYLSSITNEASRQASLATMKEIPKKSSKFRPSFKEFFSRISHNFEIIDIHSTTPDIAHTSEMIAERTCLTFLTGKLSRDITFRIDLPNPSPDTKQNKKPKPFELVPMT